MESTWVVIVSTVLLKRFDAFLRRCVEPLGIRHKPILIKPVACCVVLQNLAGEVRRRTRYRVKRISACGGCLGDYRR